jgi:predicted lipid carrier protein YhbT
MLGSEETTGGIDQASGRTQARPWHPAEQLFSPALLAGLALAPLPLRLLQPFADRALAATLERHPKLLARLAGHSKGAIGIDPVELPFVFLLDPAPARPRLLLARDFAKCAPAAVIRGSFATLVALCEGRLDGDAAFFARRLTFEGDTEMVLALRNAIDSSDIRLRHEVEAFLGVFARPVLRAAGLAGRVTDRLAHDMAAVSDALLRPLNDRLDRQNGRIGEMTEDIAALRRRLDRMRDRP